MNCSEYNLIEVDEIPGEHEWVLIDQDFAVTLVVQRGCWSAQLAVDAWAAYRRVMRSRGFGPAPTTPPRHLYAVG